MTFWQSIWSDTCKFYRPIFPWFLKGFGLILASIPMRYVHPLFADVLGYVGVGCFGTMFFVLFRQIWRMQVAKDGVENTAILWAITLLSVVAFEYWRHAR